MLSAASGMQELVIPYTVDDQAKTFMVDAIEGPAHLSYELPGFFANQKRYVESKDKFLLGSLIGGYNCEDAENAYQARWRRCPPHGEEAICNSDPLISSLSIAGGEFRPCGLVAVSLFMDRYELVRDSDGANITLNESGVALDSDFDLYRDTKVVPIENASANGPFYTIENKTSWLKPVDLEHFMVWMRTPASPRVRHLWATIPGGLEAGTYTLRITENSRVWSDHWEVPEKRIIISKGHPLGSPGGATFLGVVSCICCIWQVIMVFVFIFLPKREV